MSQTFSAVRWCFFQNRTACPRLPVTIPTSVQYGHTGVPITIDRQTVSSRFKIKVFQGIKALHWMLRELLRIIQRSGISPAFVCEGYPSQSFSIHQRATENKSTLVRGEQTASFVPSGSQILAQSLWMYNTAKKTYYSDDMLCSLVVCCALCLSWPGQIYNITGSKSFHSLLLTVKDSRYTPSPIRSTILSFLKQSKLDAAR